MDDVRWLTEQEQKIWRTYLLGIAKITAALDSDLRRFGIDIGEYEILVCLMEAENHRLRMSDLAVQANHSRSRLTHTVTRMERDGLVIRETCPDDRRGVWARLTDAGEDLLIRAAPRHVAGVRHHFIDVVAPEDFLALGRAFEAVLAVDTTLDDLAATEPEPTR